MILILYRFNQSKIYTETLIEAFPCSIELWIELLVNPETLQNINEVNLRRKNFFLFLIDFIL
jgi:hypothetical protein